MALNVELLTIKQLADELGVDKNKVNYQANKLSSEMVKRIDGVKHLTIDAQSIIKTEINKLNDELNTEFDTESNVKDSDIIQFLNSTIDGLYEQLRIKDEQIKQLHILLSQSTQLRLDQDVDEAKERRWWEFWRK